MTRYLYNLGLLLLMFVSGAETRGIPVQVKAGDLKTERYSRLLLDFREPIPFACDCLVQPVKRGRISIGLGFAMSS